MAGELDLQQAFQKWKIGRLVDAEAQAAGIDPALIHRIIAAESAGNPTAVSKVGAQGLMQLMPGTAKELGVTDPFDPAQNIKGGTAYLKKMLDRYQGDTRKALMAYNAGPGNVDSGKAATFKETQGYLTRTMPQQSPAEIKAAFAKWQASQEPPAPSGVGNLIAGRVADKIPNALKHPLDTLLDSLPTLGGAAGGLIGGLGGTVAGVGVGGVPGAIGGAALGGAAGKGAQDLVNLVRGKAIPPTAQQAIREMATSGAVEGATQAVGMGAGKLIGAAGKSLVKRSVRPSIDTLRKAPNIIDDIIKLNLGTSRRGLARGERLTSAAADKADAAIADVYQSTGTTVPATQIAGSLQNTLGHIAQKAEQTPDLNRLANFELDFLSNHPPQMPLPAVQALKRAEQKEAQRVYDAAAKGAYVPGIDARMHADMASGAQDALEQLVPGLHTMNKDTQRKLLSTQAIRTALERQQSGLAGFAEKHGLPVILGAGGALGYDPMVGLSTMAALEVLTNPAVESFIGRGLAKGPARLPYADIFRAGKIRATNPPDDY